ncbi:NAD(P)H-binding protein [Nakamurella sp. YIM 132087]|uniref:NAD(P)H-binding protein n=1 Tax=Nakamurella alba TaxID=2665158 RepID=A0A7K1FPF5_9ACTN|nr:NAD(P)H-binding protein [Nakamurella alba]MTD16035.1 NAD(P)H-binding protein [Nakamurella alba]
MNILVTGASGFVGSHLARELVDRGHQVRAMTRHPEDYTGAGDPVAGDVFDEDSLDAPLQDVEVAYYLVHSLDSDDFEELDAKAATAFATAAAAQGVSRIVYLGGLGGDEAELSPHLRSRRQVERLLADHGVPVTVLRAAVVVGHGSISWEITRQLVAHLPAMIAPRWVETRTQPIALVDVIRYLAGVLEVPATTGRTFDIGGPDVLRYIDMLKRAAAIMNQRSLPTLSVPLLTPRLSSGWLSLVTDVDLATARNLVDSMTTEVVVHNTEILDLIPGEPLGYDEAVRVALADREKAQQDEKAQQEKAEQEKAQQQKAEQQNGDD